MVKYTAGTYYDQFFKRALSNLLRSKDYHTASPVAKHRMLVEEFEKIYWEEKMKKSESDPSLFGWTDGSD